MIEWIVSSSVLILAVIAIRFILRNKLTMRLRYALWALVLVRLLIPFSIGSSPVSVQNALPQSLRQSAVTAETARPTETFLPSEAYPGVATAAPVSVESANPVPVTAPAATAPAVTEPAGSESPATSAPSEARTPAPVVPGTTDSRNKPGFDVKKTLMAVYCAGTAAAMLVFFGVNLQLRVRLRRSRKCLETDCRVPVYVTGAVDTPCLFGLFRPEIYVTEEAAADPQMLKHVLAHEMTHLRRGDSFFTPARELCLALHWYNPLVWAAALLSRNDSELACDEATVKGYDEAERTEYGRTLIGLTCSGRSSIFVAGMMMGNKKNLKERIKMIANKPKFSIFILIAVLLAAALAVCCTFTGQEQGGTHQNETHSSEQATDAPETEPPETEAPTAVPAQLAKYDANDYAVLRDFFESASVYGLKNGSQLFPNYDPNYPSTWTDGNGNAVIWDDNGSAIGLNMRGTDGTYRSLNGMLDVSALEHLQWVMLSWNIRIESLRAVDMTAFGVKHSNTQVYAPIVDRDIEVSGGYAERLFLLSAKHTRCDITGQAESNLAVLPAFNADITVDGEGYAGISACSDENCYVIRLKAVPKGGRYFVGWFDEAGELVSEDPDYELFGEEAGVFIEESGYTEFRFTARFAVSDAQIGLVGGDESDGVMLAEFRPDHDRVIVHLDTPNDLNIFTRLDQPDHFVLLPVERYGGGYFCTSSGDCCGAYTCRRYIVGDDGPEAAYAQALTGAYRLLISDKYEPVEGDPGCHAALTLAVGSAGWPRDDGSNEFILDAVVAYSPELRCYVELVFEKDLLTEEQLKAIAKSIRIVPCPIVGDVSNVNILPGESKRFSDEDITEAIGVAIDYFGQHLAGCILTDIFYAGDDYVSNYQPYSPWPDAEMLILISNFMTGPDCPMMELGQNAAYDGYNWVLIRNDDGQWEVVSSGY